MAKRKQHVFLSYCRDNAKEARTLHDALEARGLDVWWDHELIPGQDWELEIQKAMSTSSAVIVCFSKEAAKRERSGMYPELREAIASFRKIALGNVFLVPVRFSKRLSEK